MASSISQPPQPVTPGVPSQQAPSTPAPSSTQPADPTSGGGGPVTNGNQHYSLRWNNHQSHVLHAFEALLQNESLVDCTLVCEDTSFKAHKVVLSACSPYFQKIFIDNSCKHPVIVLKDIRGWEVQCIIDFMYKGETSVPEAQLTCLIKAAESLKVRGLTSSDQGHGRMPPMESSSRHASPMPHAGHHAMNGYHHGVAPPPSHMGSAHRGYSPSPARDMDHHHSISPAKIPHLTGPHSNQSSPMSLTNHQDDRDRHRASPGPAGSGPRRKQARPRRRSGDSIGNASLDLSKSDSPPLSSVSGNSGNNAGFGRNKNNSPTSSHMDEVAPENLSIRPSSSPAINLVKTETLMEDGRSRPTSMEPGQDSHRHHLQPHPKERDDVKHPSSSPFLPGSEKALYQPHGNGMHPSMREHEARAEALQALNFMAAGGGLPPHFTGHPLVHPPHGVHGQPMLNPSSLSAAISSGRPTSTPSAPSNSFNGVRGPKGQHSAPRGGPPRSWTNDELTKALENVWNKRMTTSQASRVYGIPYNSLLMYVRGKYGKSLKLDKLKRMTPAAHDSLNTIGNSRSTPKEKLLAKARRLGPKESETERKPEEQQQQQQQPLLNLEQLGFLAANGAVSEANKSPDFNGMPTLLNRHERVEFLEKHMSPERAKLFLPFFEAQLASGMPITPPAEYNNVQSPAQRSTESPMDEDGDVEVEKPDHMEDKERQVREILIEAANNRKREDSTGEESEGSANGKADEEKDDESALKDEEISTDISKPLEPGNETS